MELAEIILFFQDLPIWGWIVLFLIFLYLIGDTVIWDYEVKFPLEKGIGRGEVELERLKKKGTQIEIKLDLEPAYQHKRIEISRNGLTIYVIESLLNTDKRVFIKEKTVLEKPEEGDEITVKIDGKTVFSGRLVLD